MEKNKLYVLNFGWDRQEKLIMMLEEEEHNVILYNLYGDQFKVSKENAQNATEYVFKKGEKTFLTKQMKKIEKLHNARKKLKEIEDINRTLLLEARDEMKVFDENKEEFSYPVVRKLLAPTGMELRSINTHEGSESVTLQVDRQIDKYASTENYPFLYLEYDNTLHYHEFEVKEYFDVKMTGGYQEKLTELAKAHGLNVAFDESFELGDKNTVYVGIEFTITPKNKMNFKKFKAFAASIEFLQDFDAEKHLQIKKKW